MTPSQQDSRLHFGFLTHLQSNINYLLLTKEVTKKEDWGDMFLVGEDCSTGTANSQANLQQKDLSSGNTSETPGLTPADVNQVR